MSNTNYNFLLKLPQQAIMTPDSVIQRIEIAAKEGNRSIINYLKRQLPRDKQKAFNELTSTWRDQNLDRFQESVKSMASDLVT